MVFANFKSVCRKTSDSSDMFVQSGWSIASEKDKEGRKTYYTGYSYLKDNETLYFQYDHLGNARLVTDASGNIIHKISYESYGEIIDENGYIYNKFALGKMPNLFIGEHGIRCDQLTGLYYMRYRWYSKEMMRFINPDRLLSLNGYAYVNGEPVNHIDLLGLMGQTSPVNVYNNYYHWQQNQWNNAISNIGNTIDNIGDYYYASGFQFVTQGSATGVNSNNQIGTHGAEQGIAIMTFLSPSGKVDSGVYAITIPSENSFLPGIFPSYGMGTSGSIVQGFSTVPITGSASEAYSGNTTEGDYSAFGISHNQTFTTVSGNFGPSYGTPVVVKPHFEKLGVKDIYYAWLGLQTWTDDFLRPYVMNTEELLEFMVNIYRGDFPCQ